MFSEKFEILTMNIKKIKNRISLTIISKKITYVDIHLTTK